MNIETHLILVSAQAVPNITPVLDENFKPRKVIMLVSPDMQKCASWLEAVIKKRGVKTERRTIDDPWDIGHVRDGVLDLLAGQPEGSVALNATGGTKLMSIAAYEVFRSENLPIFYVHPEEDRVIWLYPPNRPSHELADRLKMAEFFQSYGAVVTGQGEKWGVPNVYRVLTEQIIRNIDRFEKPLSTLNFWAAKAEQSLSAVVDDGATTKREFVELIDLFQGADLLTFQYNKLSFPNEEARFFVNGGWLEQHVYGLCLNLKKQCRIQDIGRSIEVERVYQNKPVKNEIDVAFLKDNRLFLIECKTKRYADKHPVHSEGAQTLYKLDTLKDLLGGLQARAMLVSFAHLKPHDLQRADDLGISVCCRKDLAQLQERLQSWLK